MVSVFYGNGNQTVDNGLSEFCTARRVCIDKTSSAELSEAINSMYQWYRDAKICYSFLSDVPPAFKEDIFLPGSAFRRSRWFSRGWTLQELIAPQEVEFFAEDWSYLGNKQQSNQFIELLHSITGVRGDVLRGVLPLEDVSIAARMEWAATSQTTHVEDIAYCLLGIFNVNMPLLYGEGHKAFLRLQRQILLESDDQSIFAWYVGEDDGSPPRSDPDEYLWGLLADSPSYFRGMRGIESVAPMTVLGNPWAMTSKGMRVEFYPRPTEGVSEVYSVVLNCEKHVNSAPLAPIIHLRRPWGDQFARVRADRVSFLDPHTDADSGLYEAVYVR